MLTITVSSHNAQPIAQTLSADFTEAGGTIGRSPENTLTLLDPDRKISRTHASVLYRDGNFLLRDQGSVVPVLLNGTPLGNGREAPIGNGDEIRIAGYVLQVAAAMAAAQSAAAVRSPAPVPDAPTPAPAAVPAPPAAADPAPASPTAGAPHRASDSMIAPVLSWDSDAPSAASPAITTVILAATTHADPAHATDGPPAALPTPPAAAPAQPAAVAPAADDELLRALLAGAGLRDVSIPGGLSPRLMHQLGELLHEATRGLIDLLAARAQAKQKVRADMTVIVARDNNPLKFAPNVEAALAHLLVPRGRGFMPPLRAVGDAYDDLRAHQLGFMEGMRSAMALVLARFDPETLEKQMTERSMVDSILPTNRKAKLWDMFGQLYGDISKEAEADFHALFGQEFLRAYQARVGKAPDERAQTPEH